MLFLDDFRARFEALSADTVEEVIAEFEHIEHTTTSLEGRGAARILAWLARAELSAKTHARFARPLEPSRSHSTTALAQSPGRKPPTAPSAPTKETTMNSTDRPALPYAVGLEVDAALGATGYHHGTDLFETKLAVFGGARATAINSKWSAAARALADAPSGAVALEIDRMIGADKNTKVEAFARYRAAEVLMSRRGISPER